LRILDGVITKAWKGESTKKKDSNVIGPRDHKGGVKAADAFYATL
jgi:hypothetical protein